MENSEYEVFDLEKHDKLIEAQSKLKAYEETIEALEKYRGKQKYLISENVFEIINSLKEEVAAQARKLWVLSNWKNYDLVDSEDEMVELLNILQKHDATLDDLHNAGSCSEVEFCDIMMKEVEGDRDIVTRLKAYNLFFKTEDEFCFYVLGIAESFDESLEDFLKEEKQFLDYMKTEDGYVVQLHY